MIATKDSFEPHSSDQLPNSKKVYVEGTLHKDVRVPMREIELAPTKSHTGRAEVNEPVRVYDCSGPWGDPARHRALRAPGTQPTMRLEVGSTELEGGPEMRAISVEMVMEALPAK